MHHLRVFALLDVGGTKVAAARGDGQRLEAVQREPTQQNEPLAQLVRLIDAVMEGAVPSAIAVSVAGPFDRSAGAIVNPPGMPVAWHGLPVSEVLSGHYGTGVVVENDANCAGLAEALWGAAAGLRTVVYFTVSTGIGSALIRDGSIWIGRHDTEGGHQVLWPEWAGGPRCHCGGAGCLETLASGRAIERRFGVRAEFLDDPAAWDDVGRWLGLGTVNAVALTDPDAVVFGGGVVASWDRFAPSLHDTVRNHLKLQPAPLVLPGSLGEERNLLGAGALAASVEAEVRSAT